MMGIYNKSTRAILTLLDVGKDKGERGGIGQIDLVVAQTGAIADQARSVGIAQ